MVDDLLTVQDQEEALSRVYAHAVAARAGYTTSEPSFDRDGVDLSVQAGGAMRPAVDLQLKATKRLGSARDGFYRYPLRRRNYDLLITETQTPRLLVVLDLPEDEAQWMSLTEERLILRRCAYWVNLKGQPESSNTQSVTVQIPTGNIFDVEQLRTLMERSRTGSLL